jgi:hypothetical protein
LIRCIDKAGTDPVGKLDCREKVADAETKAHADFGGIVIAQEGGLEGGSRTCLERWVDAALAECKAHATLSRIDLDGQRKTASMVESKSACVIKCKEERI